MIAYMEEPDDLKDLMSQLIQGGKLTAHQRRALGAMLNLRYEPPWWYWLDYFRANRN